MIKVAVALRDDLHVHQSPLENRQTLTISSTAKSLQFQHRASLNLNSNQTEILDAVTKYTVLSVIATLCSQLNTLVYAVILIIKKIYPGDWSIWGGSIGGIFFCIDCIINPICLYLLFAVNRKIYRLCCNKCHKMFGFCLRNVTQKRVKKKYLKISQDHMQMQLYAMTLM